MDFIPESNELFIQQLNREQNTNKVWVAKIGSATPENIFTDKEAAWLDTNDNILWLKTINILPGKANVADGVTCIA